MSEKDTIKDLFSDKLSGLESQVRPELWGNISSQIGAVSTASGISVIAKTVLGITAAASIAVVGYLVYNGDKQPEKSPIEKKDRGVKNQEHESPNPAASTSVLSAMNTSTGEEPIQTVEVLDDVIMVLNSDEVSDVIDSDGNKIESNSVETNGVLEHKAINEPTADQADEVDAEHIQAMSSFEIMLPNTFTPNGDGVNEVLNLSIPIDKIKEGTFSCVVIDRFGKTVYQTTDINFQWDGLSMSGDPVNAGDYVYYITAEDQNGLIISKYSMLHIVR